MKVLFLGSLLFVIAFALHLILWKLHLPRRQIKVLLLIFFSTLIVSIVAVLIVSSYTEKFYMFAPTTIGEYLHMIIFFVSLTLAYMITYSAIEVDSPSLVMIMTIANAGSNGLDKNEFERILNDELLVKPRLRDIITDKMAYLDNGKYKLTSKGILFAHIFIIYRKLLNAPKGG